MFAAKWFNYTHLIFFCSTLCNNLNRRRIYKGISDERKMVHENNFLTLHNSHSFLPSSSWWHMDSMLFVPQTISQSFQTYSPIYWETPNEYLIISIMYQKSENICYSSFWFSNKHKSQQSLINRHIRCFHVIYLKKIVLLL